MIATGFIAFATGCLSPAPSSTSQSTTGTNAESVPQIERAFRPQVMIEGRNTYFMADLEKLKTGRGGAGRPPVSRAKAEKLARKWLAENAPHLKNSPKASGPHQIGGVPSSAYYLVDLGTIDPSVRFQEVLVLMDSTIVPSELK